MSVVVFLERVVAETNAQLGVACFINGGEEGKHLGFTRLDGAD